MPNIGTYYCWVLLFESNSMRDLVIRYLKYNRYEKYTVVGNCI